MPLTTDPNDAALLRTRADGQQETYLVLPEAEREKEWARPPRRAYKHVGARPTRPTRPLTEEETLRYAAFGYVCFEEYPPGESSMVGRYWTQKQLDSGCGTVTTMGQALAETYARCPAYYQATFCRGCGKHLPVGEHGEFVWEPDGSRVGT